ncbi:DUSAM domain-containing protein [Corallococcus macrosporus]|uniref:DUSAM domain-containing protein n=1 Tax=Myxococcus fulvus (strain ATCC BAA-855 / HW-1) TaxID=483219 RepID=F8CI57_MYXFH|nr:DUSAM domain-containing protein [Corallococcus macrosporus]AEI62614.1 hypothetical protein LILAB_03445 [Corallococcus macrosporus]
MSDELDWDSIRALARRVLHNGEPLTLTDDVKALLARTATEVGIGGADAARALATEAGALDLLRESSRRIGEGSDRLMDALYRAKRYRLAGDFDSARQEMRNVLAVEVVPHYRKIAESQLKGLDDEP